MLVASFLEVCWFLSFCFTTTAASLILLQKSGKKCPRPIRGENGHRCPFNNRSTNKKRACNGLENSSSSRKAISEAKRVLSFKPNQKQAAP